jgi:hypothetical protein
MMGLFTILGLFALWGFAAWLGILIILVIADAIWTHGLATSYLHGTGMVLSQVWSGLQLFLTFAQRVVAMAPRALQIGLFMILGVFALGLITNWFLAADVVCSNQHAYKGDSIVSVWFARMYSNGENTTGTRASISISNVVEMWFPTGTEFTVNGVSCTMPEISPGVYQGVCSGADCILTDLGNGTTHAQCAGTESSTSSSSSSGILQDQVSGVNEDEKASYFSDLFSKISPSRQKFIDSANNATSGSFVDVTNSNGGSNNDVVTYTCSESDEIQVGLWGQPDFFSMQTMLFIMCFVCAIGILLYVKNLR